MKQYIVLQIQVLPIPFFFCSSDLQDKQSSLRQGK